MDPSDLADDALGRVEILTVEQSAPTAAAARRPAPRGSPGWWDQLVDGLAGRVLLVVVLVAALCVGLLLTR